MNKFLVSVCNLVEAVNSFLQDSSGNDNGHIEAIDEYVDAVSEAIRAAPELGLQAWLAHEEARVDHLRQLVAEEQRKYEASSLPAASRTKPKPKLAASEILESMVEDELLQVNEWYELGIDLHLHKTLLHKRHAILFALQSAKMLED